MGIAHDSNRSTFDRPTKRPSLGKVRWHRVHYALTKLIIYLIVLFGFLLYTKNKHSIRNRKMKMERSYIKSLSSKIGEEVLLKCWLFTKREQGGLTFLLLRDISGTVQGIVTKENVDIFAIVNDLPPESVFELTGLVKERKQAPNGHEIQIGTLRVLSLPEKELPIPV